MSSASEIDRIAPEPVEITLTTGYTVALQRLKTRQFFRLLRVLTRGLGPAVVQAGLDFNSDPEGFGQKLLTMVLLAIPDAEQQFIDFLQSMCLPPGLHMAHGKQRLDKQQLEDNQDMLTELLEELNNPELEDLLELAEAIVRQEAPDIQALGKRVASLLELARKTGQLGEETTTPAASSSPEPSQPPSISSATSTDGPTRRSSSSRSPGSASASRPRQLV